MIKNIITSGITAAIAALVVVALVGGNQSVPSANLGGSTADNWNVGGSLSVTGASTLTGSVTADGGITYSDSLATTTSGNTVLTQSDLGYTSILVSATGAQAKTITLPATSTLTTVIPSTGDVVDITIANASSTALLTFAPGTGVTLQQASSTLVLGGSQIAVLRLIRLATTDVIGYFSQAY